MTIENENVNSASQLEIWKLHEEIRKLKGEIKSFQATKNRSLIAIAIALIVLLFEAIRVLTGH